MWLVEVEVAVLSREEAEEAGTGGGVRGGSTSSEARAIGSELVVFGFVGSARACSP